MRFAEMTSAQLAQVDRQNTLVVAPIAAVEQHGPHMPTGTDTIICTAVCEALESRLASQVLLTPTLWLGASSHHLRLGSTLDARLANYVAALGDLARSILDDGYQRLLFINGHGGNVDPMRVALREVQPKYPQALLAGGSYWAVAEDLIANALDGEHRFVGHACEFETSMVMHLRPELVDDAQLRSAGQLIADSMEGVFLSRDMKQRTREGFTGRPDLASAEKGARLFEEIIGRLESTSRKLCREPLGLEYQDFASQDEL